MKDQEGVIKYQLEHSQKSITEFFPLTKSVLGVQLFFVLVLLVKTLGAMIILVLEILASGLILKVVNLLLVVLKQGILSI